MMTFKRRIKFFAINLIFLIFVIPVKIVRLFVTFFKNIWSIVLVKSKIRDINLSTQFDGKIDIVGTAHIQFGDDCRMGDHVQLGTEESGRIDFGSDVRVNRGTTIFSYNAISIGDHVLIGEFSTIRDANHGTLRNELIKRQTHKSKSIRIDSDVWIGRGVCILPGVSIGVGAVIGANSVVTRDIPSYSIAVGAPAKVIGERK